MRMYNTDKDCPDCGKTLKWTRLEHFWCENCWEYKTIPEISVVENVY